MPSQLTVATWNVNGLRARAGQFLEWAARDAPDVICLQEIKATREQIPPEAAAPAGYRAYWHGNAGGYSGVGLLIRDGVFDCEPVYAHPPFDMESRLAQATVGDLVLASVYIPNGGKDYQAKLRFVEEMEGFVTGVHAAGARLILCGDMNITRTDRDIHPSQNKPGMIGARPDERELFERMIAAGLVDVGRKLDPDNDRLFTWWPFWRAARERNLGWRLDYIFASESIAAGARRSVVLREVGTSDHAPVIAEFDLTVSL